MTVVRYRDPADGQFKPLSHIAARGLPRNSGAALYRDPADGQFKPLAQIAVSGFSASGQPFPLEWTFDAGAEGWKVMTADQVTAEGTYVNLHMIDPQVGDGYIWTDGGSTVFDAGVPPEQPFGANFVLRTGAMDIPAGTYALVAEVQSDLDPAHSSAPSAVGSPDGAASVFAVVAFNDPTAEEMAAARAYYEYLADFMIWLVSEYINYLAWRLTNPLRPASEYPLSTPVPRVPDLPPWPANIAVEALVSETASTVTDFSTGFVTTSIALPDRSLETEVIVWPGGPVDSLTIMLGLSGADSRHPWRLSRVALVPVGSDTPVEVPSTVTPDWTETPTDILEIVTEVQAGVQKPPGPAWPDGPTVDLLASMKAASVNGTFEFVPPLRFAGMTAVWEGDTLVLRWPAGNAASFLGSMWAAYFPSDEASIPHPNPTMNVDGALGWVQKWESTGTLPIGTTETDSIIIAWGSAPPEEQYPERGTLWIYSDDGLSGEKAILFTDFYYDDPAYVSNKGTPGPAFWYIFGTLPAGVDVPAGEWRLTKAEWTAFFTPPPGPDMTGTGLVWTFDTDAAGWFDVNAMPDPLDPVTTPGTPAGWADGHAIVQAVDQGGTDIAGFGWYSPEPIHLKAGSYHIVAEIQRAPGFNYGTGGMRGATWFMTAFAGATIEEATYTLESSPGADDGWAYNIAAENTDPVVLDTSTRPPTPDSTGPSTITIASDGDWFLSLNVSLMTLWAGPGAATGELWLNRVAVLDEAGNVVQV